MSRTLLLALALALLGPTAAPAQPSGEMRYQVTPPSRFWIDGSATTGPFSCEAGIVGGQGRLRGAALDAEVRVPVRAFDCGLRRMNRDFQDALLAETHPEIAFRLDGAELLGEPLAGDRWVPVRATGTLQLAGTARRIVLAAEGRLLPDGRVRLRGHHPLRMSAFGIEPPSGLLGLVRAHDEVVARFDLAAALH